MCVCVSMNECVCVGVGGWWGGGVIDGITACMCHSDVCVRVSQNEINIGFVCP